MSSVDEDFESLDLILADLARTLDSMRRCVVNGRVGADAFQKSRDPRELAVVSQCLTLLTRESRTIADSVVAAAQPLQALVARAQWSET